MLRRAWFLLLAVIVAAIAWVPLGFAYRSQFDDSIFQRWKRPATAADRPNVWFDGSLAGPEQEVCAFRKDLHRSKQPTLTQYLTSEDVTVAHGGEQWTVALADLEAGSDRAATKDEISGQGFDPRAIPTGVAYRMVCAKRGDRIQIDACVSGDGARIVPCVDRWAGVLRPSRDLANRREWERTVRSLPIDIVLHPMLMIGIILGVRSRRAGHRMRPLVPPDVGRKTLGAVAIPALVVTIVLGAIHGPVLTLVVPIAAGLTAGFLLTRASVFHAVAAQLVRPPAGMIVLEGAVGEETPLGKASVTGASAALTLVSVARVVRGKNVTYVPVGEVQDVGELQLATDAGTFALDLDDAILELQRDAEILVKRSAVPKEISSELALGEAEEFRLREYALQRGDRITVLIAGAKAQARAESASAYRSAAGGASVEVPAHARPAIFEGTLPEALASLRRKARGFEIAAGIVLGAGIAAAIWILRVALLA
jgi:hypothetical protein